MLQVKRLHVCRALLFVFFCCCTVSLLTRRMQKEKKSGYIQTKSNRNGCPAGLATVSLSLPSFHRTHYVTSSCLLPCVHVRTLRPDWQLQCDVELSYQTVELVSASFAAVVWDLAVYLASLLKGWCFFSGLLLHFLHILLNILFHLLVPSCFLPLFLLWSPVSLSGSSTAALSSSLSLIAPSFAGKAFPPLSQRGLGWGCGRTRGWG